MNFNAYTGSRMVASKSLGKWKGSDSTELHLEAPLFSEWKQEKMCVSYEASCNCSL